MQKILFTPSSFNRKNIQDFELIQSAGFEFIFNPYGRRLSESEVLDLMDEKVVGLVAGTEPLTQSVINRATSLRVIARCGIGLDNVDLHEASHRGISVYNTPDAPTSAVAELTLAHILSLSRYMVVSHNLIHEVHWKPMMGRLLSKQTVGIIGFGRIGRRVAELLNAFGVNILVYDNAPVSSVSYVQFVALEELLKQSDVITLHIPYAPSTHHMIDEKALSLMKSTALLVNVARGGLIDEAALYTALKAERLAGAALDCFETEPYGGPLLSCGNVQVTAHMGSYAKEARDIMEAEAFSLLVRGLREHGLLNEN